MRPRNPKNIELPSNLYARKMARTGAIYYAYRDPTNGKEKGLGMDKSSAVLEATKRNMQIGDIIKARHAGSQLENGIPKIKRGYVDELGLFERCTIVNTARGITPISGIYFLVHNAEIVYIGQSRDVLLRLSTHVREDKKIFTSFAVVEAPPEKLDDLEAKYIAKFAPILNIQRPVLVIISSPILG